MALAAWGSPSKSILNEFSFCAYNYTGLKMSHYPLVVIGAGAAGLGASELATKNGVQHVVLEASHRIGGRGLTEMLEEQYPVDLGCHWMHSASVNPYVKWADQFGFFYETNKTATAADAKIISEKGEDGQAAGKSKLMHFDGQWLTKSDEIDYALHLSRFDQRVDELAKEGKDCALWDAMDQDSRWTQYQAYWLSLLHSNDPDEVSILDQSNYLETEEDYPLREGYGALISEQGRRCPVELNIAVLAIKWGGPLVQIETNKGVITADKIVLTISTGILAANDIEFTPALPLYKLEAIHALPMGNYNNLFFSFEGIDPEVSSQVQYSDAKIAGSIMMQPFGKPYAFTSVAGRFAWWLEKQGPQASEQYFRELLINVYGSGINKRIRQYKGSAWGYDSWVKGAYSSAKPGFGHIREVLAQSIDERLFFAGEATSLDALNTAHGAYLSGKRAFCEIYGQA
ncbi:MAG: NAD(P)-binding protein [Gammaproteobacteria bacterium]|nr:NAD(P)-binding protein [Gammaproteobacteria bacterium]